MWVRRRSIEARSFQEEEIAEEEEAEDRGYFTQSPQKAEIHRTGESLFSVFSA
jgi:hypothetical protein